MQNLNKNIIKKALNKYIKFAVIIILFLSAALSASAQDIDMPYTTDQKIIFLQFDNDWNLENIKVARDNYFYRFNEPYLSAFSETDEIEDLIEYPFRIELLDRNNNLLDYAITYEGFVYMPYYEETSKIRAFDASEFDALEPRNIYFEEQISFCNNNNICEPCEGIGCSVSENSATCSDCSSGSSDLYCDLKNDGICDPDCNNIDMDCQGCTQEKCYYEDSMDQMNSCNDIGGEICINFDECAGDVIDYNEQGYCCIGFCVDPSVDEEYIVEEAEVEEFYDVDRSDPQGQDVEEIVDPVILFSQNYDDSIPVEDETNKIYCSDVGKTTCEYLEKCFGERIWSDDEGYDCCTGDCAPLPDNEFDEIYEEVFGEEYKEIRVKEIVPPKEAPAEFISLPEIKKLSAWWLLLLIIPSIIAVSVLSTIKKKKSQRRKRIEYEYDYYKKYGYTNEQMKKILKERGWKKEEIKKVIKK